MEINIAKLISESYGGENGEQFEMRGVTSVQINAGEWVDAIIVNGIQHGGDGSSSVGKLTFNNDEYISRIEIRTGERDSQDIVTYLKIQKNDGDYIEGGSTKEKPHIITGKIIALGGRSGKYLDKLTAFGEI